MLGTVAALALTALILAVALAWMAEPAAAVSVQPAPGCQGTPVDPEIGDLCPDESIPDEFNASVTGDIGSGAAVSIEPTASPCSEQDAVTDIFIPDGCYSRISVHIASTFDPLCAYIDSYDDGVARPSTHEGKAAYACNSYKPSEPLPGSMLYTDWANANYRLGLSDDNCSAQFDEAYTSGGPPGNTWPTRGPASLTCTYQRPAQAPNGDDTQPNGLYGPTWIKGTVTLEIQYSDGTSSSPATGVWIPVDGVERPRPPIAAFQESKTAAAATYEFLNSSVSQKGQPMSYEWTFEALEEGDPDYTQLGNSGAMEPVFTFDYGKFAAVTLDVTDDVNGMTDSVAHPFTIERVGPPPPPGGDLPVVTVEATDASAAEAGPDTGTWTLSRTKAGAELTVNVSTSGTASEGSDYAAVADTATFPAGEDTVEVLLTPVAAPPTETAEVATMTVEPGDGYTVGDPSTGDITILGDSDGSDRPPEGDAKVKGTPRAGQAIRLAVRSSQDGKVVATGSQEQTGGGKGRASSLAAVVSGRRIKVKLKPVRRKISANKAAILKLVPMGKKNRKKAKALAKAVRKRRARARAKLTVKFINEAGNSSRKKLNLKLK